MKVSTSTVGGEELDAYERDVAGRMLVAVARAHGGIGEAEVIERFAAQLGVPLEERVEIERQAKLYVIEQFLERAIGWGGHDEAARAELLALADRLEVSRASVERAEARFLRRRVAGPR